MDYDNLIERLRKEAYGSDIEELFLEAATALSTILAENEKLRAELENYRKGHCSEGGCAAEKDRDAVLAELEQVKAERDAAVSDIETALAYGMKDCELCKNSQCYVRGGTKPCLPKWRGQKED